MTTASVLLTVSTTWSANNEKCEKECEKEERIGRGMRNVFAIAARELRETPTARDQAVRLMREWIQKNTDIKNVRTDESFLLRFLRQKKYSIPMAQQTLLKYLSLRTYYPISFKNLDSEEPKINEIISNGYIAVSPVRDSEGRRVVVYNICNFDATKFNCWDMCRVHIMIYECLMEDPVDQICGIAHVGDGQGATAAHVIAWNPIDFGRLFKWGEQSVPMRHKVCHIINLPSALKYIIDFATSKVPAKMVERLKIHSSLKELHKHMDPKCLPTSYGGQIPQQDMIQFTKQLLSDNRKNLLSLDDMEILSTRGIISSRRKNNGLNKDMGSVEGSFRKLEID